VTEHWDELTELREQNAELATQVKRLVRTEAKLYEIQERLDEQSATYRYIAEMERKLASSRDIEEILLLGVQCAMLGVRFQRAVVLFAEESGAPLRVRFQEGYEGNDRSLIAGLTLSQKEDPLVVQLSARGEPMHCYADGANPILVAFGARVLMTEYIVLPLTRWFGGKDAGILVVGNAKVSRIFTRVVPDDPVIATLGSVANHVAMTIQNVRNLEALRARNTEVEEANRMKSAFLATMSHELRTPLNAVIGFTRIVMRKAGPVLPPLQLENLTKVESSACGLLTIINDILDLSKVEAGRMSLHYTEVDARAIIGRLADQLAPLVGTKDIVIVKDLPEPVVLHSDVQRLEQIVTNLVSNAIKFTKRGSVRLRASLANPHVARIEVRDTGIGIRPEDLRRIFEPFHQVHGGPTREVGGTGLGLAIVQKLVSALGGEIRVESTHGEGSAFIVDLPVTGPSHVDTFAEVPVT
jgi:signal transduction histidine kinase